MSEITVTIPGNVARKARALASARGLTLEGYITSSLAHDVLMNEWLAAIRARRGKVSGKRFLELLDKAPDVPPMPGDEIPPDLAARLRKHGLLRRRKPRG